ncbi:hypothetical protein P4E94_03175 [Pontiellaceae bacterium B12219]|nr:hypothetical protein [Pontiellaceae bacterium B12219]
MGPLKFIVTAGLWTTVSVAQVVSESNADLSTGRAAWLDEARPR